MCDVTLIERKVQGIKLITTKHSSLYPLLKLDITFLLANDKYKSLNKYYKKLVDRNYYYNCMISKGKYAKWHIWKLSKFSKAAAQRYAHLSHI